VLACRNSSKTSSTRTSNAASWHTVVRACAALTAGTTSSWRSVASGAGFAPRAGRGACRRPPRTCATTSSARVPVRQWVLSLPIPLRLSMAAQPVLVTPLLQVVHRVITRHLLDQTGCKAFEADSGAVTLIQRFGSAANLHIHLHCLMLDGVYRRTDSGPVFVQTDSPTDEELRALLHRIITRLMQAADASRRARRRGEGIELPGRRRGRFG